MANITLKDVLIGARQEAYRMRHFYVGTEHLFIALLEIRGSITGNIVQEYGLTPEYVIDAIRRKVGKGGKARLWAGVPNTPRAEVVLDIAHELAIEEGRDEINERDLLVALFEEEQSLPLRVLRALGLHDLVTLMDLVQNFTINVDSQQPYIRVDFGQDFEPADTLSKDQLYLLRRMFYGYPQIRVERRLTGGYSDAILLVVTPLHADKREDAAVVVKINRVDRILDEVQRYESHVKTTLPPMTARIEDKPVTPEASDIAGIKYTLVAGNDGLPRDLRMVLQTWTAQQIADWLAQELFPTFGRIWWGQTRPYRFQVWQEYDWLLPPILTLDYQPISTVQKAFHLKMPIKRAKLRRLDYGDRVVVENFIVHRVFPDQNRLELVVTQGNDMIRAFKVDVRGVDLTQTAYYRGEVVEALVGTLWQTRNQQLLNALRELEPDFDPREEKIRITPDLSLPNPVWAYEGLLDTYINGSLSTIHGDLHPGNIMIGPNQSAFLIDFAHTRDGHTLFDWATLEASLLGDYASYAVGDSWDAMREAVVDLSRLNGGESFAGRHDGLGQALFILHHLRAISGECLLTPNQWSEYYIALAFCGLRALSWDTVSVAGRRLLFLMAGLAIHELRTRFRPTSSTDTPSPDDTELSQ